MPVEETTYGSSEYSAFPIGTVNSTTLSFVTYPPFPLIASRYLPPVYFVRAYFADGTSAVSDGATPWDELLTCDTWMVRGDSANTFLVVAAPPDNLWKALLYWNKIDGNQGLFDFFATNLVHGVGAVAINNLDGYLDHNYGLGCQMFSSDDNFGVSSESFSFPYSTVGLEHSWQKASAYSFVDARRHMKENLIFLLRSASRNNAFGYLSQKNIAPPSTVPLTTSHPETFYVRPCGNTNYEYYGFHYFSPSLNCSVVQELRPVQENYYWSNFVYNPQSAGSVVLDSGSDCLANTLVRYLSVPVFEYNGSRTESNPAVALANGNAAFLYYSEINPHADCGLSQDAGIAANGADKFVLSASVKNCFGLNVERAWLSRGPTVLEPNIPSSTNVDETSCYVQTAIPNLQTVDYYFASQTPYFNYNYWYGASRPPIPGSPDFTVTNASPVTVMALGQSITFGGWAKQAILNGYSNKFAYLEQYFDRAWLQGTTNSAGLLSPYGDFTPTMPGAAALVTMPDIDTGQQGTGIVNVVKLQLDVNHDGVMDLSLGGPDNTSRDRPLVFWINDDHDEPAATAADVDADQRSVGKDARYLPDFIDGKMHCQRNLEDFARLWICGLPSMPPNEGYSVRLSMVPSTGSPAINLYAAYDPGIGYLTNSHAASNQFTREFLGDQLMFDYSAKIASISATQSYTIPFRADGSPIFTNFLFEGAGAGFGRLILSVVKGTNFLAETEAWIDLRPMWQFYEAAEITDVDQFWPSMVENPHPSSVKVYASPAALPGRADQVAVYIHGWRLDAWTGYNQAETLFKRLYWQGYQGRFAALHWPTRSKASEIISGLEYLTFNRCENIALESGYGAANYLQFLRNRYTNAIISVCSQSQGAAVTTEAMKQLVGMGLRPIDNYVIMQGAFPAQAFDINAPPYPLLTNVEANVPTPNLYQNYAAGITNALRPGGRIVNFYNPIDFALSTSSSFGAWELNNSWYATDGANGPVTMKPNTYLGYYTTGTSSILRTNHWNQDFLTASLYDGYYNGPTRAVTNTYELLPFVARSRTKAVGASANVGGVIYTSDQIDLQADGFSATRLDHTGEFRRNIQDAPVQAFYPQLRRALFPPQ